MSLRQMICIVGVVVIGIGGAGFATAQVAPPPPPPRQATLWSFLGIPQTYARARDNFSNRNGNRPQRERVPPLKRIADPENLKSENPAIKKAAEVKKEEDLAKQKIKAVKYLTQIGCGCYNRDGSITDALLKALDDCTEEVRYETVLAITEAANGEACENCKNKSCCSEEISNKLYEMAYERDDTGCYLEPSERVRLAAAEALRACCPGGGGEGGFIQDETDGPVVDPIRGGGGELPGTTTPGGGEQPRPIAPPVTPPQPVPPPATPIPTPAADPAPTLFQDETGAVPTPAQKSSRRTAALYGGTPNVMQASVSADRSSSAVAFASEQVVGSQGTHQTPATAAPQQIAAQPRPQPTFEQYGPAVAASVDLRNNQATISFPNGDTVPVGSILRGYHNYAFSGKQAVGDFIVIQSTAGFAIVRAHGTTKLNKLITGDDLIVLQ
jgi:hypothetical protein